MSQAALAEVSGVSLSTVGVIERGQRAHLRASTLARLDRALGWPVGHALALHRGIDAPAAPSPAPTTPASRPSVGRADVRARVDQHLDRCSTDDLAGVVLPLVARLARLGGVEAAEPPVSIDEVRAEIDALRRELAAFTRHEV